MKLIIREKGICSYEKTLGKMQEFTKKRDKNTLDEVWFLEHENVYTLGQTKNKEHLKFLGKTPLAFSDRGGQVTFHGKGQLIIYTLFDLQRLNIYPRKLIDILENSIIQTLISYKIKAHLKDKAPGVYVDNKKIASLGLRIKKGASYHGIALNLTTDLSYFNNINPCGFTDLKMCNLSDFCSFEKNQVQKKILDNIIRFANFSQLEYFDESSKTN